MWCDLVRLLRHFGKDTHCPKYVCPADLKKAHDRLVRKREEQIERERAEQRREQLVKDEKNYLKSKGKFFGLVFTDNLILVKVIESVAEMQLEGKLMHHCVGQPCREQCRTYPQADECLIYRLQNIHDMEIKIENILILWDEKVTDIFVSLINTLSLSFSEKEIRNSMAKLSENENFGRLFAYGFGAHHLWVAQRFGLPKG